MSILIIEHHECGREEFAVTSARYNLYQADDGVWEFVIRVETDRAILRSTKLEGLTQVEPHLEATIVLPENDLLLSENRLLHQPQGYDYTREENLTDFYYFSHESIEELRFVILQSTADSLEAQLTGETIICGSNGTRPDATLSLRAFFRKDGTLRRSFT